MAFIAFYFCFRAHYYSSATGLIGIFDALNAVNVSSCGEVWSLDILHQTVGVDVRIVDVCAASVNDFSEIVRGNVCRHSHGDTVSAVYKQVGNLCRHDGRFCQRIVKVVCHVDSVLFEVVHNVLAHLGQPALCITHGGR